MKCACVWRQRVGLTYRNKVNGRKEGGRFSFLVLDQGAVYWW